MSHRNSLNILDTRYKSFVGSIYLPITITSCHAVACHCLTWSLSMVESSQFQFNFLNNPTEQCFPLQLVFCAPLPYNDEKISPRYPLKYSRLVHSPPGTECFWCTLTGPGTFLPAVPRCGPVSCSSGPSHVSPCLGALVCPCPSLTPS